MPRQSFGTQNCHVCHCGFRYTHHSTYTDMNRLVYNICGRVYLFVIVTQILKRSHSSPPPLAPSHFQSFQQERKKLETAISQCLEPSERRLLENSISKNWQSYYPSRRKCHHPNPPPSWSLLQVHKSIITYALNSTAIASFLYV